MFHRFVGLVDDPGRRYCCKAEATYGRYSVKGGPR